MVKNFWTNFCCADLLFVWAQKVCVRFLKFLFQTEDIKIFDLRGVFLGDMFI